MALRYFASRLDASMYARIRFCPWPKQNDAEFLRRHVGSSFFVRVVAELRRCSLAFVNGRVLDERGVKQGHANRGLSPTLSREGRLPALCFVISLSMAAAACILQSRLRAECLMDEGLSSMDYSAGLRMTCH